MADARVERSDPEVTPVAAGILAIGASTADGKLGVVAGTRAALAIDGGIRPAEGEALAAAVRSLGHRPERLYYTHGHIDHVLGGSAFIGGEVIAHRAAAQHIVEQLPAWAEREQQPLTELEARVARPTITFVGDLELDLGGRIVRLLDAPGHAPGATVAFMLADGVLFGGDTLVTGIPPYFRDGDHEVMEATLRRLADLGAQVLVPGHGDLVLGVSRVREAILWSADYLARVRDHVAARLGRYDLERIVAEAAYDAFIGDRLPRDRHRMEWRHEQSVRIMAEQLTHRQV
jgi:glyoxylase-like metal-dependent hydrolase (beta-lactamase superfamily II)